MTNAEAIKILNLNGWGYTDGELKEATQMAVEALESKSEAEEYRTPKKLKDGGKSCSGFWYICPTCGKVAQYLCEKPKFCFDCGQALDWSEVEE